MNSVLSALSVLSVRSVCLVGGIARVVEHKLEIPTAVADPQSTQLGTLPCRSTVASRALASHEIDLLGSVRYTAEVATTG